MLSHHIRLRIQRFRLDTHPLASHISRHATLYTYDHLAAPPALWELATVFDRIMRGMKLLSIAGRISAQTAPLRLYVPLRARTPPFLYAFDDGVSPGWFRALSTSSPYPPRLLLSRPARGRLRLHVHNICARARERVLHTRDENIPPLPSLPWHGLTSTTRFMHACAYPYFCRLRLSPDDFVLVPLHLFTASTALLSRPPETD